MSSVIIDTNPLAYIYNGIPDFGERYAILLNKLAVNSVLLIPKIVYGELSLMFRNKKELDAFLSDTGIVIGEIESKTYITAAKRWQKYKNRRVIICHRCGARLKGLVCQKCNAEIKIRQHILSDFIIGAYALEAKGKNIVTSDAGYYSTYFPELNIITANR